MQWDQLEPEDAEYKRPAWAYDEPVGRNDYEQYGLEDEAPRRRRPPSRQHSPGLGTRTQVCLEGRHAQTILRPTPHQPGLQSLASHRCLASHAYQKQLRQHVYGG